MTNDLPHNTNSYAFIHFVKILNVAMRGRFASIKLNFPCCLVVFIVLNKKSRWQLIVICSLAQRAYVWIIVFQLNAQKNLFLDIIDESKRLLYYDTHSKEIYNVDFIYSQTINLYSNKIEMVVSTNQFSFKRYILFLDVSLLYYITI